MDPHVDEGQPAHYVKSAEKTLAVLLAFTNDQPRQTVSSVAASTVLSRAAARRFLLTLTDLGYLRNDGTHFELAPRCLDIGASFLANLTLPQIAEPHLKQLSIDLNETTSLCILDGTDIVYVARVASPRLLSVSINVGTRFPAWATSMGRVLIGGLPRQQREEFFEAVQLQQFTERSISSVEELRAEVDRADHRGWSMVTQELEDGLRGIAVPVVRRGEVIAAVNVSLQTHRAPEETIERTIVPLLTDAAKQIADDYGGRHNSAS
ncbi:IclR family transcriptional regulator domain-containing protein [Arthrobacter castelli]|uniref:IclR family transcriptional regulator domain-containing protein n=1 Tax=Arthrobacter castelli TaxID=271431 RepID=UPI00040D1100|nr:IclR family transcriptional regulator C-terminal domain-containing protein [Arthrobacter castelli]